MHYDFLLVPGLTKVLVERLHRFAVDQFLVRQLVVPLIYAQLLVRHLSLDFRVFPWRSSWSCVRHGESSDSIHWAALDSIRGALVEPNSENSQPSWEKNRPAVRCRCDSNGSINCIGERSKTLSRP